MPNANLPCGRLGGEENGGDHGADNDDGDPDQFEHLGEVVDECMDLSHHPALLAGLGR